MKPQVRIYTGEGQFIDREMNDFEFAQYEKDQAEAALKAQAKAEATAKKAALLNKLGITDEEAKLLLA